jgi:hypothetical protein
MINPIQTRPHPDPAAIALITWPHPRDDQRIIRLWKPDPILIRMDGRVSRPAVCLGLDKITASV